jgi:hypothetical protein
MLFVHENAVHVAQPAGDGLGLGHGCHSGVPWAAVTWARTCGFLLAMGVIMTGCSDNAGEPSQTTPSPSVPVPVPGSTPSSGPSAKPLPTKAPPASGGLTIRYLDSDGKIKTVRVEDFAP